MRGIGIIAAVIVAGAAWAIPPMAVGGFGGVALPLADMAAEDDVATAPVEGGNLGMSPKFGVKYLYGAVPPYFDLELTAAYHLNHPAKDYPSGGVAEPETTYLILTLGASYNFVTNVPWVFYSGVGAGYYMGKIGFYEPGPAAPTWAGQAEVNKPGIYVCGGGIYQFGAFGLDVSARLNYVLNSGTYAVDTTHSVDKDYNDMFIDIVVGLDYFI